MIYERPAIKPLGNVGLLVELGDEANLELSFRVSALKDAVERLQPPGVHDFVVTIRSLGILFDPLSTSYARLRDALEPLLDDLRGVSTVASRLVRIPVWYDDPWSAEVAARYGVRNNIELVADHNGLTVEELIAAHSGVRYWIAGVGHSPGTYFAYSLGPREPLTAPKYETPRDWTPARMLCLGGSMTSAYPLEAPGGYQLLGRTPLETYDPLRRGAAFADGPALARAGDQHVYVPIDETEYRVIRAQVQAGTYEHDITPCVFDCKVARS